MTAYYNEIDPYAAAWLRNLIGAGHIAPGEVDERSIEDVCPQDLDGFTQCHFFAGVGVWSFALRQAGWPDTRPVWTGSCPCQPFSKAGDGAGFDDHRHLWPHFQWLIEQRKPTTVFGEQVAHKGAQTWIDLVQDDLEGLGYSVGAIPFPACGVGAPHIRERLYWVGHTFGQGLEGFAGDGGPAGWERAGRPVATASGPSNLAALFGCTCGLGDAHGKRTGRQRCGVCRALDSEDGQYGSHHVDAPSATGGAGPVNGYWSGADWLYCRDDRWRPVEPGTFPMANGTPSRVGRVRAYGNAVNAQAAQAFIESAMAAGVGLV